MTGGASALGKRVSTRRVQRVRAGVATAVDDSLAVEEPLEIRVSGEALAVTMRTPGDDQSLVLGFLFAEGLIAGPDDVGTIAPCGRTDEPGYGNVVDVTPGPGTVIDVDRIASAKRGTLTTAACGVCGRRSIDDLVARVGLVPPGPVIDVGVVLRAPEILRDAQPGFERTGGLHAAAVLTEDGTLLSVAEDVGRHNAVDKVVGALVRERIVRPSGSASRPSGDATPVAAILVVSGRTSFEIVQKAAVARIPIVAGVSAASTLACDLAETTGITLCGFVRDGGMVVYARGERLAHAPGTPRE